MFDDFLEDPEEELFSEAPPGVETAADKLPFPRENPGLLGHDAVEKKLLEMVTGGGLPHALIFAGPDGIGKATMAFRLARFLLKQGAGGDDQDSLFGDASAMAPPDSLFVPPEDPVFRKTAAGGHPDLLTIERPMDERKGEQKGAVDIDSARRILPFLRMTASSEKGWRIVIVDDADTMNRNAQNAVLKILEEPPPRALLILIVHRAGAMIPTIRSRCRVVAFSPLPEQAVTELMARHAPGLGSSERDILCRMAGGRPGRAIRLLDEGGGENVQATLNLMASWPAWDWQRIHVNAENLGRAGQEKAYKGFQDIMLWSVETLVFAKARGLDDAGAPLSMEPLRRMMQHYSLEEWLKIWENLKDHFALVQVGNLDRRQAVLGAFSCFS